MRANDRLFWIWLAEALGIGNPDRQILLQLYENPYDLFCADAGELEGIGGLSKKTLAALNDKSLQRASEILDTCEQMGIGIITVNNELYPQLLREIKHPPILLYYIGKLPRWNENLCVGMVGTRKMSAYGMETAYKISYELASANSIVVSGMAEGIDGVCAAAALKAGGMTVAVLGCGLDQVYPKHHGTLMRQIAENGLLLSEYPPGTKPLYYHFPVRNRIISGISHGVVVVEAGIGSGSLITAKEAKGQNRDVFAVPANADGVGAAGADSLLKGGAHYATEALDIVNRYQYLFLGNMRADLVKAASRHSAPELDYLKRIGVISLAFGEKATPVAPQAEDADIPAVREYRAPRKNRSQIKLPLRQQEYRTPREPVQEAEATVAQTHTDAITPKQELHATAEIPASVTDPVQRAVLQAMPPQTPMAVDTLLGMGQTYGDVLVALTMLEIAGLVQKLPGSQYQRT